MQKELDSDSDRDGTLASDRNYHYYTQAFEMIIREVLLLVYRLPLRISRSLGTYYRD